jgi:hypothetical protein
MNTALFIDYFCRKLYLIADFTRNWILWTVLLVTLLVEDGLSQSVDIHDRKPDEVVVAFYFDHRLVVEIEVGRKESSRIGNDDYLRRGMVPPRSVYGSINQTLLSHTPKELDDEGKYHKDKRSADGKLVSSPGTLVFRFSNVPGEEYRFKVSAARPCDKCVAHFGDDYPISYEVRADFFTDSPEDRVVFVENPYGSIRSGTYGHSINVKNRSGEFSVRCIEYKPRESTAGSNPAYRLDAISDELSVFREFADQAYQIEQMPSTVTAYGNLGAEHLGSQHADLSSGDLSPRFLESFIYGDSKTHRSKKYTFDVVDIADGGGWYEPNKRHPAGAIPAGFKAISLRCTCCPNDPKYVVSFAGTDPWSPSDLLNDAMQGIPIVDFPYSNPFFFYPGLMPGLPLLLNYRSPLPVGWVASAPPVEVRVAPHYEYALKYTSWVKEQFKISSYYEPGTKKIQAVGHSLGGGMASYVSGYHKISGYGFNSAPLGAGKQIADVMKNAEDYFIQIRAVGDPVSGALPMLPFQGLPGAIVDVECKSWIPIFGKHSVVNISDKILSYR